MKDVFDLSAQVPIQMSGMRFDQIASELFPDFSRSRLSSWSWWSREPLLGMPASVCSRPSAV